MCNRTYFNQNKESTKTQKENFPRNSRVHKNRTQYIEQKTRSYLFF